MDNSHIEEKLDEVQILFDRRPEEVETGLDVGDPGMLQLRKACRLLEAARQLIEENGFYTVVIETSFGAIERTLQFYLQENDSSVPRTTSIIKPSMKKATKQGFIIGNSGINWSNFGVIIAPGRTTEKVSETTREQRECLNSRKPSTNTFSN